MSLSLLAREPRNLNPNRTLIISLSSTPKVKATESILQLTRQMKEGWLFGQVKTVGKNKDQDRVDESAREVTRVLEGLLRGLEIKSTDEENGA